MRLPFRRRKNRLRSLFEIQSVTTIDLPVHAPDPIGYNVAPVERIWVHHHGSPCRHPDIAGAFHCATRKPIRHQVRITGPGGVFTVYPSDWSPR